MDAALTTNEVVDALLRGKKSGLICNLDIERRMIIYIGSLCLV